jgi:hypothetical protein
LLQQGFDFARMGVQIGQQFAGRPQAPPPAPPLAPAAPPEPPGTPPAGVDTPGVDTGVVAPPTPAGPPQSDPLSLLRMIVSNPQVMQALQPPTPASPRAISLPMPAPGQPGGRRGVSIPLGAVMNAIFALAGQSMDHLNANTREDDPEVPEYLIGEDGEFLVDPANSAERADLVARIFEISEQASYRPAAPRRDGWM